MGVCLSLRVGEALLLPLGMWPECFAHTGTRGGGAGAVLGGRGALGQRAGGPPAALRVTAPPRPTATLVLIPAMKICV